MDREEKEVIEEINPGVLARMSGKALSLDSKTINLSESKFQLINLDGLQNSRILQMEKLEEVVVDNNKLKSIDILQNFRNIRLISATNNMIVGVNIDLPRLRELNLSYNKL